MSTIRDIARSNFPATYDELENKYPGNTGLITTTVNRLLSEVLLPSVDVDTLSEASRAHLGDIVTLRLIPAAIDMYQVEARLSDGAHGESIAYYDRIDGLLKLRAIIEKRVDKNQSIFDQLTGDDLQETAQSVATPRVSSSGSSFVTMNPNEFRPINDV